jgi:predicted nucleic acid-binding protein
MKYLLDVNVLIALGLFDHEFHQPVARWVSALAATDAVLATCSLTELGFVRVLAQTPQYALDVAEARRLLNRAKLTSPVPFEFIVDDQGASDLPSWVRAPKQVSDGHLARLAKARGAEFVTLDRGIPGAFLIPPEE